MKCHISLFFFMFSLESWQISPQRLFLAYNIVKNTGGDVNDAREVVNESSKDNQLEYIDDCSREDPDSVKTDLVIELASL